MRNTQVLIIIFSHNMRFFGLFLASIILFSVIGMQESFAEQIPSPRQQLADGVSPEDILCRENRILVLRNNGNVACVTEKTAEKTGWEIIKTEFVKSKIIPDVTFAEKSDNTEFQTNEESSQDVNKILVEEKIETDTITLTKFDEDEFSFTQFNATLYLAESKDLSTIEMKLEFLNKWAGDDAQKPLEDIIYKIQILRDGQLLARNLVSSENGISNIKIISNPQCDELDLWRCVTYFNSEMVPTNNLNGDFVIKGPVFTQSGDYDIKINLKNYFGAALVVSWQVNDKVIISTSNEVVLDIESDPILTSILETDLVFANKEIDTDVISESGMFNYLKWPEYKMTFPRTAQVGIPFDVVYDYAYVIPDEETGSYVNFNEQCSENNCGRTYFSTSVSSFVTVDDKWERLSDTFDVKIVPMRNYTTYTYHPEFDNTKPLQETFTFVINRPDADYRIGEINISMVHNRDDLVYFYVDSTGTIIFDPMMTKKTFEQSSFATTSAASAIEVEMDKLRERPFDPTRLRSVLTVVGPDNPPDFPEYAWNHYAGWLLEQPPDVDYREWLLEHYFTEDWVNKFLKAHPELQR